MSIFSKLKRKKHDASLEDLPPLESEKVETPSEKAEHAPRTPVSMGSDANKIDIDNIKAKVDLVLTDLANIKIQNQNIMEKLRIIEQQTRSGSEEKPIRYY